MSKKVDDDFARRVAERWAANVTAFGMTHDEEMNARHRKWCKDVERLWKQSVLDAVKTEQSLLKG